MQEDMNLEDLLKKMDDDFNKEQEKKKKEEEKPYGDPNQKTILLPDGRFNEKYIDTLEEITSLDELEEQKLKFEDFPASIRNDILRKALTAFVFIAVGIIAKVAGLFPTSVMCLFILISFIFMFSTIYRYKICSNNNIVKFEGIIVDANPIGILRSNKVFIVKISNNEKFLNVKLSPNKSIKTGMPITLYMNKNEPIVESDYGPLVENIISYALSVGDETHRTGEEMSAEEYVK